VLEIGRQDVANNAGRIIGLIPRYLQGFAQCVGRSI